MSVTSIEVVKHDDTVQGIIRNPSGFIIDIAEHPNADEVVDILFERYDIGAVQLSDGTLDTGDQLSVREVAELITLGL